MHLIHDTIARREWNGRRLWLIFGRGADQRAHENRFKWNSKRKLALTMNVTVNVKWWISTVSYL